MEIPGNEVWSYDGQDFSGCPFRAVTEATKDILRALNFYNRHGLLPNTGTWLDQAALFIEAVEFSEAHHNIEKAGT